ncbi:MAG: ABC transporter ATP-binding protein [Acidobacteria bacterium]|nr:MAG: ABC transporter ATP-binding protein [Acidobacteriota bacterium]
MISITGVSKRFGDVEAISDVSLEIRPGETFALLGPNGSGKSTTLKCVVGLSAPNAGQIRINGYDVYKRPREARRLLSYLPQRAGFPESLTIREVADFYGRLRLTAPGRYSEVAASTRFEFNGLSDRPVGTLSGGMLQRLGLLVACLPDVPVLILDEPMINLDPEGAVRFRDFLLRMKEQGKTIVFSSHILTDVEQLADRVGIFVGGRLASVQSVDALREALNRQARMRLTVSPLDCRLVDAALQAGAREARVDGQALVVTSSPEARLLILKALQTAGADILQFTTEEPSLEDFYMTYLRESRMAKENGHEN